MTGNLLWETEPVSKSRNGERHEEVYKSKFAGAGLLFELQLLSVAYDTMPERSHVIVKASSKGVDYAQAEFYVVNDDWVMELPLWSSEADNAGLELALIEFADREVMKYAAGQARDRMGRFASGGVSNTGTTIGEYRRQKFDEMRDKRPVGPWQDKWTKVPAGMTPQQLNAFRARTVAGLRRRYPDWSEETIKKAADSTVAIKEKQAQAKVASGVSVYEMNADKKYTVETKITDDAVLNNLLGDVNDLAVNAPIARGVVVKVEDGQYLGVKGNKGTMGSCNHPNTAEFATSFERVKTYEGGTTIKTNVTSPYNLEIDEVRALGPVPLNHGGPMQINLPAGGITAGYQTIQTSSMGINIHPSGNYHMVGIFPESTATIAHEWGHAVDMQNGGYRPNYQGRQPYVEWLSYKSDAPTYGKFYNAVSKTRLNDRGTPEYVAGYKRVGGLSDYGQENKMEGFAEMWSDLYLADRYGHTPAPVSQRLAAEFLGGK